MSDIGYHALPINDEDGHSTPHRCSQRKVCCGKVTLWKLLLSLFLLISASMLVTYFAVIPMYIQKIVNKAEVSFVSVMMKNLTNSSFVVTAQSVISTAGPINAIIIPAKHFSLSYQNSLLGHVDLPTVHSKAGEETKMLISDHVVSIANVSTLLSFAADLINGPNADWDMDGHVDVVVWGFRFYKIKFKKTVSISGMNGLNQIEVENFTIPGDESGKLLLTINGTIYNPSFVEMEIGDIHLDIIYNNYSIGSVVAPNITLVSGINYLVMTGEISPKNENELGAVNDFVNKYISGIDSEVSVSGTGGSSTAPPWVSEIIRTLHMTTTLKGANLTLIYNISLSEIFMKLPGEAGDISDSGQVIMSSFVSSGFTAPFPIYLDFQSLTISSNLTLNGEVFGIFAETTYPVTSQSTNSIGFQMQNATLQIVNRPLFMNLIETLLLNRESGFNLCGIASGIAGTRIGNMELRNVYVNQFITLEGIDGFANHSITVLEPNDHITNGYPWGFQLYLDTIIYNPSSAAVEFSRLSFDIYYKGALIGNATAPNIYLGQGPNHVIVYGNYTRPSDPNIERDFMSTYLQGNETTINLVGNSYNVPLAIPAMLKLNISVTFPGNNQNLVRYVKVDKPHWKENLSGTLALFNPIDCTVYISSLTNFKIFKLDWTYLTESYDTYFDPKFSMPPAEVTLTQPMKLKSTWHEIFAIPDLIGNHTLLATGEVGFQIQEFGPVIVDAQQEFTLIGYHIPIV